MRHRRKILAVFFWFRICQFTQYDFYGKMYEEQTGGGIGMYKKGMGIDGIKIGHVQGIATDTKREFMYYSCTTYLVKTDMDGNVIGTVKGLAGHLGCIAYNYENGKVYGSLEYKHDIIGNGILECLSQYNNADFEVSDRFYIAIFDVDKIDRMDMDAEADGVMTVVHLKEVLDDYAAEGHRYGCSGIDGITFAPVPGDVDGKNYLYVAYGIYSDLERDDNDYQVILRYDIDNWSEYEKALSQNNMHLNGPEEPDSKYFLYTGNTTFGIQNLEYDKKTGYMFAAVYKGEKGQFPNFPMFVIDMNKSSEFSEIKGINETGEEIFLASTGKKDEKTGIWGIDFPYGSTGIISLGDGYFYFSKIFYKEDMNGTVVDLFRFNPNDGFIEV